MPPASASPSTAPVTARSKFSILSKSEQKEALEQRETLAKAKADKALQQIRDDRKVSSSSKVRSSMGSRGSNGYNKALQQIRDDRKVCNSSSSSRGSRGSRGRVHPFRYFCKILILPACI